MHHQHLKLDDVHSLTAKEYPDLAARNADTGFQITESLDMLVRVNSVPVTFFMLTSVGPSVWDEVSNSEFSDFTKLGDTPSVFTDQAGKVVQVKVAEDGLEFGQTLRAQDSPQFTDLTLTGDLTVQGTTTTIESETLVVTDKNIELGNVETPTDDTADGGGITLHGATDKIISWLKSALAWTINQSLLVLHQMSIGSLTAPATDASLDLKATDKALLLNRLTTTQRDALNTVEGMVVYNTTTNQAEKFNGTVWVNLGASGGDVTGPASALDNTIARFDGATGKVVQDSNASIDDTGVMTIKGQTASRKAGSVTEIFSMDDFPDPVGGVITLPSGKYSIRNNITTSDRFVIGTSSYVTIEIEDSRNNVLTYTGTGTLFTSNGAARFVLYIVNILCTGAGAQLFDVNGGTFTFDGGIVDMQGVGSTLGDVVDSSTVTFRNLTLLGYANGIVVSNANVLNFHDLLMQGNQAGTGALISILDSVSLFASINTVLATIGSNESVFFIDPIITAPVNIRNTVKIGSGTFFKAGTTGSIASFTDVSTSITAATVTDSGGSALFNAVSHPLNVGETVDHTTFVEASYNGAFVVTAVTADTYEVGLAFVSTDSGLYATTTAQVNDTGHGRSNGETLSIFGTVNFGGGYAVFNVQTDTFEITLGKAFPGSETTGNWDTGSLDEKSKFARIEDNGVQKDSKTIGDVVVEGNTTATVIEIQGVSVNLNLNNSAEVSGITERFTLTNKDTGEIRYDGLNPTILTLTGLVAASSQGGGERFNFRLLKNGSPLPSPDDVNIPIEVGASLSSAPLNWPVSVNPGDLFRVQVENAEGSSDIIIDTLKISIS